MRARGRAPRRRWGEGGHGAESCSSGGGAARAARSRVDDARSSHPTRTRAHSTHPAGSLHDLPVLPPHPSPPGARRRPCIGSLRGQFRNAGTCAARGRSPGLARCVGSSSLSADRRALRITGLIVRLLRPFSTSRPRYPPHRDIQSASPRRRAGASPHRVLCAFDETTHKTRTRTRADTGGCVLSLG